MKSFLIGFLVSLSWIILTIWTPSAVSIVHIKVNVWWRWFNDILWIVQGRPNNKYHLQTARQGTNHRKIFLRIFPWPAPIKRAPPPLPSEVINIKHNLDNKHFRSLQTSIFTTVLRLKILLALFFELQKCIYKHQKT